MSYSFTFTAATREAAKEQVSAKLAAVVDQQPVHAVDVEQAKANAFAAIDLLPEDPGRDIQVVASGYVSGTWDGGELTRLTGVSVNVNVALVARPI